MKKLTRSLLAGALITAATVVPAADITKEQLNFFETKIRPVLANNCYKCHSAAEKVKGGLTVDSKKGLLAGGSSGEPSIVPGNPQKSLLLKAISYQDGDMEMPPNGKLPDNVLADFERWVKMGAPDPRTGKVITGKDVMEKRKNHWAFQPVRKPRVPNANDRRGGRNPIDALVLAQLRKQGITPSPVADRTTLIRRVFFDLTGLPPTPRQFEYYVAAKGDWYGELLTELLGSRHYGERWARHWMDVARYSDTRGPINRNREPSKYSFAWTYRDYLIDAFNDDKPYDQFIMEQLAVDDPRVKVRANRNKLRPALGFLTLGQRFAGNPHDVIDDRIDVTSKAFLGLTVSCARCHDHKFDPIPTMDYYSWYGIFANSKEHAFLAEPALDPDMTSNRAYREYEQLRAPVLAKYKANERVMKMNSRERQKRGISRDNFRKMQNEYRKAMNGLAALDGSHPGAPMRAHALYDVKKPREYKVFNLGDPKSPGDVAPRRFLEVLSKGKRPTYANSGSGRYELASDIANKNNPLTARVMMNRVWLHHFGETFVATPEDFGNQSNTPANQPLLDYLSAYFMENGWSVKKVHRLIMTSNTYKQQSVASPRNAAKDPYNKFFWRQNVKRLEFEAIRDSILSIGDVLDRKTKGIPEHLSSFRRTIYTLVDRNALEETLFHFDFANPDMPTGKRSQTTVPLQALFLMNSPLVIEQIKALCSERVFTKLATTKERLDFLFERIYQRQPTSNERQVCALFISESPEDNETVMDRQAETARNLKAAVDKQKYFAKQNAERKVQMMARQQAQRMTEGAFVKRAGLIKWEKLAHSMIMANEMFYVH